MAVGAYEVILANICITAILAASVQVVLRSGILSLATVGFAGVGAYATAVLAVRAEWHPVVAMTAGVVITGLVGYLVALLVQPLRSVYLALATVAFVLVVQGLAVNIPLTGGPVGLPGIPRIIELPHLLVAAAVVALFLSRFERQRAGRATDTVREDEVVARAIGINVADVHRSVFLASAVIGGLGGALMACYVGYISPSDFGFGALVRVVAVAVVGGIASWKGAYLGAVLLTGLPGLFRVLSPWRDLYSGVLLILAMLFAPGGLWGLLGRAIRRPGRRSPTTTSPVAKGEAGQP